MVAKIFNRRGLARLAGLVRDRKLGLLAGAGVSQGVGYPGWSALIERMMRAAKAPVGSLSDDALLRADFYRKQMGEPAYARFLTTQFKPDRFAGRIRNNPVLRALVQADFPFYVTTNYDHCLEVAHEHHCQAKLDPVDWRDTKRVNRFLLEQRPKDSENRPCFHLHGVYDVPDSVVLTESDYRMRYYRSDEHRQRLFLMLFQRRFLIVGFSLEDADLKYIFREQAATLDVRSPKHFAILPYEDARDSRERLLNKTIELKLRYSIEPVFYPVKKRAANPHAALLEVLDPLMTMKAPVDPDDPQRGQWGGRREGDRFQLEATVKPTEHRDWFEVTLTVLSKGRKSDGEVAFHLHDSFDPALRKVKLKGGRAQLTIEAYGAFTVGAEVIGADGHKEKLEYDLAETPGAPKRFTSR